VDLSPGRPALVVSALISALVVPWLLFLVVAPALGSESIAVVVPLAVFALVALATRPRRRDPGRQIGADGLLRRPQTDRDRRADGDGGAQ
jgi:hypothetical protein